MFGTARLFIRYGGGELGNTSKTDGKNFFRFSGFFAKFGGRPTYRSEAGRFRALLAICSLHFINDLHPSFLPTFLPAIVRRLSLTLGEAGFLSTLFGIVNLLVQPLAGYLADRLSTPSFAVWAPLLTASGAYLLPLAPNYGVAMLFTVMLGVGTASFHPQGHGLTGLASGTAKLGSYLAIFGAAGTLGAALSPIYGVFLFRLLGPGLLPATILLVLCVVLIARSQLPANHAEGSDEKAGEVSASPRAKEGFFQGMSRVLFLCLPLILIAIVRDSTSQGIRVFLPLLITGRGGSFELGGSVLFAFTVAGSVANIVGGKLADTFGKRRIIVIMLLLAPMFLLPAVRMEGMGSVVLLSPRRTP